MFGKIFNKINPSKLEVLLEESYHNPLKQYDLMKEFLKSNVYVRGSKQKGELFLNYEQGSLIAFTSTNTLQKAQQDFRDYVYCEVSSILKEIPNDTRLLLNTGPNYGKEFLPVEIAILKEGKIPSDLTQTYQMQAGQKLIIYSPKVNPEKLINSLFEKIKECSNVQKAYLAEILKAEEQRPNLIVGIKVLSRELFQKDIVVITEGVKGVVGADEYVDFIEVTDNDASQIGHFMLNETKPFFDREYI